MPEAAPVEVMDLEGVREAVASAEAEGWEPGQGDADAFFAADPGGFFRSSIEGRTVATISVARGSDRVAFVGLYIVAPELRGQGLGRNLWDQVLGRFDGFTLGLDAVPEQVETYASAGFVPAYGNVRFSIEAGQLPQPGHSLPAPASATTVAFDDLAAFDGSHFFGPRPGFLREWISGTGREAVITSDAGGLTGFAASRATSTGHRIGPVFAGSPETARNLILSLAAGMPGRVAVDVPQPNLAAVELFEALGATRSFETTRMYRGPAPELPLEQIFGITSLELG